MQKIVQQYSAEYLIESSSVTSQEDNDQRGKAFSDLEQARN